MYLIHECTGCGVDGGLCACWVNVACGRDFTSIRLMGGDLSPKPFVSSFHLTRHPPRLDHHARMLIAHALPSPSHPHAHCPHPHMRTSTSSPSDHRRQHQRHTIGRLSAGLLQLLLARQPPSGPPFRLLCPLAGHLLHVLAARPSATILPSNRRRAAAAATQESPGSIQQHWISTDCAEVSHLITSARVRQHIRSYIRTSCCSRRRENVIQTQPPPHTPPTLSQWSAMHSPPAISNNIYACVPSCVPCNISSTSCRRVTDCDYQLMLGGRARIPNRAECSCSKDIRRMSTSWPGKRVLSCDLSQSSVAIECNVRYLLSICMYVPYDIWKQHFVLPAGRCCLKQLNVHLYLMGFAQLHLEAPLRHWEDHDPRTLPPGRPGPLLLRSHTLWDSR